MRWIGIVIAVAVCAVAGSAAPQSVSALKAACSALEPAMAAQARADGDSPSDMDGFAELVSGAEPGVARQMREGTVIDTRIPAATRNYMTCLIDARLGRSTPSQRAAAPAPAPPAPAPAPRQSVQPGRGFTALGQGIVTANGGPVPDSNRCMVEVENRIGKDCGSEDSFTMVMENQCPGPIRMQLCTFDTQKGGWHCGSSTAAAQGGKITSQTCHGDGRFLYAACSAAAVDGKQGNCGGDP